MEFLMITTNNTARCKIVVRNELKWRFLVSNHYLHVVYSRVSIQNARSLGSIIKFE